MTRSTPGSWSASRSDGRRAYADLGSDVGISGPSAHERVKKLEARGVITGYAATVDPIAAGYPIVAFTWLTQAPGSAGADLTDAFAAIAEIEECHHIAGEADYLLKIRARDTHHLEEVIVRLQATPIRVHDPDRDRALERVRAPAAAPRADAR